MARPVIALVTDFGLRDHYVGAMKGVMLGICPDAAIVDICHEIPPHDVAAAAFELAAAFRYFPPESIFLAVVDPGVGTPRRALALRAGAYQFVAPDNGLLSLVLDVSPVDHAVELTDARYARPEVSRTFEGRDRFGPAAAWLAAGVDLGSFGPAVPAGSIVRIELAKPTATDAGIAGQVMRIDRFGNVITNIDRRAVDRLGASGPLTITAGGHRVSTMVATYAEAAPGELCALFGSSGYLEIALNGSSAASRGGLDRGVAVIISAAP